MPRRPTRMRAALILAVALTSTSLYADSQPRPLWDLAASIVTTPEGTHEIEPDTIERDGAAGTTRFRLRGAPQTSTVTLYNGFSIATIVTAEGTIWTALPFGASAGELVKVDGSVSCHVTRTAAKSVHHNDLVSPRGNPKRRTIGTRPVEIDVMEVYGPVLLREAGSASAAEAYIQHQIDVTNTALRDSGLHHIRLRLRHAHFSQHYDRFPLEGAAGSDIAQDREYYGADIVGYAVGETPFGVVGAACRPMHTVESTCGINWVHAGNFAIFPLAFAHEMGHNLGADHDAPNAPPADVDPYPYARGYCAPGKWRTLMAYDNVCRVPPLMVFSNPNREHGGLSTGAAGEADNARAINTIAPLVRDYYPATQNVGPRCEFRITFDAAEISAAGTTRQIIAERTRGDCAPAIASLDDWARIDVSPNSTAERTEATLTILPNAQVAPRRGHFVVGEQPVTIAQTGTASCLTPNGSFDQNVSGWTVRSGWEGAGAISWSPLNATPGVPSGSAAVTAYGFTAVGRGQMAVERCFAIEPAAEYLLRSSVYMPPGQHATTDDDPAFQIALLYPNSDCSGPEPSGGGDSLPNMAGRWLTLESRILTRQPNQPDIRSIKVLLSVFMASGGSFTTHWDDIQLCKLKD